MASAVARTSYCVQAKSLERQLSDTERRLQEMVTASQRQTNVSQHEVQDCRMHSTCIVVKRTNCLPVHVTISGSMCLRSPQCYVLVT